jgi:uncharacterized protein YbcV (DUF1398 family)
MQKAIEELQSALTRAASGRPRIGGFPHLAQVLREAGVTRNEWHLPACQSLYVTKSGPVIVQGAPLVSGMVAVPDFDRDALIRALRTDQAGEGTFAQFLMASWRAGVIRYEVDLIERTVTYFGVGEERYVESYPVVAI